MATPGWARRLAHRQLKTAYRGYRENVASAQKEAEVAKKYLETQEAKIRGAKLRFTRAQMTPGSRSYIPKRGGLSSRGRRIAPGAYRRGFEKSKARSLKELGEVKKTVRVPRELSWKEFYGLGKKQQERYLTRKAGFDYSKSAAARFPTARTDRQRMSMELQRQGYGVGTRTRNIYDKSKKIVGKLDWKGDVTWRN